MQLTSKDIARMMDLSAVQAQSTADDIKKVANCAIEHNCVCTFALPAFTPMLVELLEDYPDISVGGVIGFPSGCETTEIKIAQAKQLISAGCDELDMVLNIGMLCSNMLDEVKEDIEAVKKVAGEVTLKVIFECHHLTDEQIIAACNICAEVGVAWVKTGTGWAPTGATLANIALMKQTVGDACQVKGAGGIRDLETLVEMYRRGARRFGIGVASAEKILSQAANKTIEIPEYSAL